MNKYKPETLSIIELAQLIRQRPGMYFGDNITLTGLQNLLFGFSLNSTLKDVPPFEYFNHWANQKLGVLGSAIHWRHSIIENCNKDELKAFWKFYELLDEFILIKPIEIHEADLTIDNFSFYYSSEKGRPHRCINSSFKKIIEPAPYHIKLVEFDFCIFPYFYDFNFVIGEIEKGSLYYKQFDKIEDCLEELNQMYGKLKWTKRQKDNINDDFEKIVKNS